MTQQLNKIKEELSLAYLHAVTLKAGGEFQRYDRPFDDAGLDVSCLFNSSSEFPEGPIKLEIQLKATARAVESNDFFTYEVKQDQYAKYHRAAKAKYGFYLLFLLVLPPGNLDEWVLLDEDELILKGKMFWTRLVGDNVPEPSRSRSIRFYKKNKIDIEGLKDLARRLYNGESVVYEY